MKTTLKWLFGLGVLAGATVGAYYLAKKNLDNCDFDDSGDDEFDFDNDNYDNCKSDDGNKPDCMNCCNEANDIDCNTIDKTLNNKNIVDALTKDDFKVVAKETEEKVEEVKDVVSDTTTDVNEAQVEENTTNKDENTKDVPNNDVDQTVGGDDTNKEPEEKIKPVNLKKPEKTEKTEKKTKKKKEKEEKKEEKETEKED